MFSDFKKDLKSAWKDSPGWMKYVIVITTITNATSIASIADIVVEWKGFILTGIEFYRNLTLPVREFINDISPIALEQWHIDVLIIYYTVVSVNFRNKHTRIFFQKNDKYLRKFGDLFFIYFAPPIIMVLDSYSSSPDIPTIILIPIIAFVLIGYPLYEFIALQKQIDKTEQMIEHQKGITLFFINLGAIFVLFFIAAAINAGLQE